MCLGRGGACGERLATSGASLGHRDAWRCVFFFFRWIQAGYYIPKYDYHMIPVWGSCLILIFFSWIFQVKKLPQCSMVQVWNFHEFCPEHKEYFHLHSIRGVFYPTTSKGPTSHPQGRRGTTTSSMRRSCLSSRSTGIFRVSSGTWTVTSQ